MATATQARNYAKTQAQIADAATAQLRKESRLFANNSVIAKRHLTQIVGMLSQKWGPVSAEAAVMYYRILREQAGFRGIIEIPTEPGMTPQQLERAVEWAARPYRVDDPVKTAGQAANVVDLDAYKNAEVVKRAEAVVQRAVQGYGRNTIKNLVGEEKESRRPYIARVPSPGACAFCRMLASRGAVYLDEATASWTNGGTTQYHDHCNCQPAPTWNSDDLPYDVGPLYAEYVSAWKQTGAKYRNNPEEILHFMRAADPSAH